MHVRHNWDAVHDLADVTRTRLGRCVCASRVVCNCERRQRCKLVYRRRFVLGEADGGNGERGERNSRCGERRLMERRDNGADVEGTEHSHAEAGPPITNPPRTQRDQPKRLMRSN